MSKETWSQTAGTNLIQAVNNTASHGLLKQHWRPPVLRITCLAEPFCPFIREFLKADLVVHIPHTLRILMLSQVKSAKFCPISCEI